MEAFVIVALVAVALLLAELLLPTGGVLATLGAIGLVAGGILALGSDSSVADYVGPALITLGILSAVSFFVIARKVIEAHRDEPVRGGADDLLGASAEARTTIDPDGQVWLQGTVWGARLARAGEPVKLGDRVRVEAVDGLTLIVTPESPATEPTREGAS
jgi:membrane-bound serine protease (ClpP class)